MSDEDLDTKAERLVRSGAVVVISESVTTLGSPPLLVARVSGDVAVYDVVLEPSGTNTCTCPLFVLGHRRRCSHIRALQLWERVGKVWAAEQRARDRAAQRDNDRPPGKHDTRETAWPQDRRGRP